MDRGKATLFVAFLFLWWISGQSVLRSAPPPQKVQKQFLGLWVVRYNLNNQASIDQVIHFASEHGFHQLMVQVRGRGFAFYNSDIVPKAPTIEEQRFDPLAYTIQQAHLAGLEVHAWVNVYMLWTAEAEPENNNHLLFTHPEWVDADFRGIPNTQADWSAYNTQLDGGVYLAPTNPEVNAYLLRVIQEIVDKYDVDGIHCDYIRYQGPQFGYNLSGRKLFRYRYGVDPLIIGDNTSGQEFPWTDPMYELYAKVWNRYRRRCITNFMKQLHHFTKIKGVQLSAAVKPDPNSASTMYFQDWAHWLDEDLLDFVIPMNYIADPVTFERNTSQIEDLGAQAKTVMGLAVYNQSDVEAAAKLRDLHGTPLKGICIFSYGSLIKNPEYIKKIFPYLDLRQPFK